MRKSEGSKRGGENCLSDKRSCNKTTLGFLVLKRRRGRGCEGSASRLKLQFPLTQPWLQEGGSGVPLLGQRGTHGESHPGHGILFNLQNNSSCFFLIQKCISLFYT